MRLAFHQKCVMFVSLPKNAMFGSVCACVYVCMCVFVCVSMCMRALYAHVRVCLAHSAGGKCYAVKYMRHSLKI